MANMAFAIFQHACTWPIFVSRVCTLCTFVHSWYASTSNRGSRPRKRNIFCIFGGFKNDLTPSRLVIYFCARCFPLDRLLCTRTYAYQKNEKMMSFFRFYRISSFLPASIVFTGNGGRLLILSLLHYRQYVKILLRTSDPCVCGEISKKSKGERAKFILIIFKCKIYKWETLRYLGGLFLTKWKLAKIVYKLLIAKSN